MNAVELKNFKILAAEAVKYNDSSIATALLEVLKKESILSQELQELKLKLQWVKFPALTDQDALRLLEAHLEIALQLPDYDVADKIGKKISYTDVPGDQIAFMQSALSSLSKNGELIGGKTIRDLVKGYYDFPSTAAKRSSLDEINYLNQGTVTKTFSDEQKALLLAILKIIDSLKNRLQEIQAPSTDPRDAEIPKDFDYSTLIPGIIRPGQITDDLDNVLGGPTAPASAAPRPPQQDNARQPLPRAQLSAVPRQAPQAVVASAQPARPKPVLPAELQPARRAPLANLNMQDVLNRQGHQSGGVVFDNQTNVKVEEMTQRLEAERQQKQSQIDKKLEELKRRKT
jgi:hypothetical protein